MVVGQEDAAGVFADGAAEDFPGVHLTAVGQADGDAFIPEQVVARVEHEHMEFLAGPAAESFPEKIGHVARGLEARAVGVAEAAEPSGQGEGGLDFHGLGQTDPLDQSQFLEARVGQGPEGAAAVGDEVAGQVHGGAVAAAGAQEDGQQFGVTQGVGAALLQPFPGAFMFRQVGDEPGAAGAFGQDSVRGHGVDHGSLLPCRISGILCL